MGMPQGEGGRLGLGGIEGDARPALVWNSPRGQRRPLGAAQGLPAPVTAAAAAAGRREVPGAAARSTLPWLPPPRSFRNGALEASWRLAAPLSAGAGMGAAGWSGPSPPQGGGRGTGGPAGAAARLPAPAPRRRRRR